MYITCEALMKKANKELSHYPSDNKIVIDNQRLYE